METSAMNKRSTYLSGHDQTRRGRVDGNITRHEADVAKLGHKLAVLLVAQRLDGTGVDDSLVVLQALRNGVLGHDCLSCRRMRRNQHTLIALDGGDGDLLERIESEGPGAGRLLRRLVLGYWDIVVVGREGDLVADLMGEHHGLSFLLCLGLQAGGGGHLARLLRLEVVGDNGLGLGVALLALQQLCWAILVVVCVPALVGRRWCFWWRV